MGFVIAEGSFFIQLNKEIYFSIGQKGNRSLMQAIHLLFEPGNSIYFSDKTQVSLVRMSSKKDIQKVINFFSFDDHYPLIGYKKDSYLSFLKNLRESVRYKDLKFPD